MKSGLFEGLTSFRELESRIAVLPTTRERGDAFEVFAEAYFATQQISQAKEVYPLDVTPRHLLKKLGLDSRVLLLADFASQAINEGQCQKAINWIALGLYCYPQRTADEVRRRGVFRSSKYGFRTGCLRRVIAGLLAEANALSLSDELMQYMHSASNLLRVATSVRDIDSSLRKFSVRRQNSVLKTVVALVDSLFMLDHEADLLASSDNWRYYSKEDLAEAGSYLIHCFDDEIGIDDSHFSFLDESALLRGLYHNVLVKACKVRRFLESEILVDAFDYRCTLRRS